MLEAEAMLCVMIDDVSEVDAESITIAQTVEIVSAGAYKQGLVRSLSVGVLNFQENTHYIVSAYLNRHGATNALQRGDYLTMQSYPVLTFGYPNEQRIELQPI